MSEEPLIAVFIDFENLAIGVNESKGGRFQIQLVLKRLLEKGRIVYKRAYCDWSRYRHAVQEFHAPGDRADRHSAEQGQRQEQRRHPHGRRRPGPVLLQGRTSTSSP